MPSSPWTASDDGALFASGDFEGRVLVRDLVSGQPQLDINLKAPVNALLFDGTERVIIGTALGLSLADLNDRSLVYETPLAPVQDIVANGEVVIAAAGREVLFLEAETGEVQRRLQPEARAVQPSALTLNPASGVLYAAFDDSIPKVGRGDRGAPGSPARTQ